MASNWVINRRDDCLWLIGPVLASFFILGLYYTLVAFHLDSTVTLLAIIMVWSVMFDGTHGFATISRTYLDRQFRSDSPILLRSSLIVFFIGPALLLSFYLTEGSESARGFFIVFNIAAMTYAYYHLVRQHWGLIAIYRRKAGETDAVGHRLDGSLLGFGTALPFLYYFAQYYQLPLNQNPLTVVETLSVNPAIWPQIAIHLFAVASAAGLLSAVLKNIPQGAFPALPHRCA